MRAADALRSACCSALCAIRATAGPRRLNYLTRYLDDALTSTGTCARRDLPDPDVFFLALARQLGIRTAEMHRALAERGRRRSRLCARADHRRGYRRMAPRAGGGRRRHAGQIGARASRACRHRRSELAERLIAERDRLFQRDPHADPGRGRGAKDPLSRRFSPRPGYRRAERLLHHRFRGRAGPAARRRGGARARRCAMSPG